jgi:hypothetical protein
MFLFLVYSQGGLIAIQRDKGPLLTTAIKALTSIFKPTSPFLTASVMDILFNGIPIDCSIDDFSAQSLCSALENEKAIKIINETHLAFSILDGVSFQFFFYHFASIVSLYDDQRKT